MSLRTRSSISAIVVWFFLPTTAWTQQRRPRPPLPTPTHKNVKYGPHERNVLDFYKAESSRPAPLVIYIHGGGFRGGSKESLNPRILSELREAGISVAALNYRFVQHKRLPAAHVDCRRAVQFLRSKAGEWNVDKKRVGVFGGSAGDSGFARENVR